MLRISKLRTLTNDLNPAATIRTEVLFGAMGAALALALATASADAQDDSGGSPEQVTVSPPQGYTVTPAGFVPIVVVSQSRLVHYEDLDLRTEDGADALRSRIYAAARSICKRLNFQYPATYQGLSDGRPIDPDCYRGAINRALPGAEAAINSARVGYGGR
ncbi:MAG TPA: UrcA family protein [Rhizomicrobium sp.]|nr:UrcA family protein [Rhizomicrobium sp.]